jgi:hypothetical protein
MNVTVETKAMTDVTAGLPKRDVTGSHMTEH